MLDRLAETEEDLGSCAADGVEVVVGEDEVVIARIGLVGVEIREDRADVARVRTAGDAADGVVGASERYARGAVFLEVAAQLVAARFLDGGTVVHGVHWFDGADGRLEVGGDADGIHGYGD